MEINISNQLFILEASLKPDELTKELYLTRYGESIINSLNIDLENRVGKYTLNQALSKIFTDNSVQALLGLANKLEDSKQTVEVFFHKKENKAVNILVVTKPDKVSFYFMDSLKNVFNLKDT